MVHFAAEQVVHFVAESVVHFHPEWVVHFHRNTHGISSFLKEGLEEASYSVDISGDGKNGLALALKNEYNLIILDWMLPTMSGIEVCRQLRKAENMIPIIFLTAKKTLDDLVFGFDAGANDYIKKPFEFEELLARIKVQLKNNLAGDSTKRS